MAEVARRAGVSVSTVSHVVNNTRFVSLEKATLINDAIAAMGYQPNELARSLKASTTNSVGLAISAISSRQRVLRIRPVAGSTSAGSRTPTSW